MSTKYTMKPLKGDNFQVDANPDDKISDLKKKIAEARPEYPADTQKLIYSGKILSDDATIADSGVSTTGFIVVMVTKAKPPAAAEPAAAPAATPSAAPAAPDATAAANAVVSTTGGQMDAQVEMLCAMGFERPEVERCLQAAFGNPDRAVEYLTTGIPDGIVPPAGGAAPAPALAPGAQAPAAAPGGGGAFPAMPAPGAGGPAGPLPPALEELRNNPQFAQLAGMVAQNPQMLAQMLPAIQQSNPEIVQAIQQNPEAFMQMLQEAGRPGGGAGADPVAAMLAAGGGGGEGGGGRAAQMQQLAAMLQQNPAMIEQMLPEILPEIEASDPAAAAAIRENPQLLLQMLQGAAAGGGAGGPGGPQQNVIRLSEEDNAAVERLAALGFDKNTAAQAYLACDKSEELAANFLFDNAGAD